MEYLDFYAYHNMTNDSHVRVYENGETLKLPTLASGYGYRPGGEEEAKKRFDEHNAAVTKSLLEKGFDKFTINMAISAGMVD